MQERGTDDSDFMRNSDGSVITGLDGEPVRKGRMYTQAELKGWRVHFERQMELLDEWDRYLADNPDADVFGSTPRPARFDDVPFDANDANDKATDRMIGQRQQRKTDEASRYDALLQAVWQRVYPNRGLPGGGGGLAGHPAQVDGGAGYTRGRSLTEQLDLDMDFASSLPQDRIPPVSPGLSGDAAAEDWIAHERMAEGNWQAELDRRHHDAVWDAGQAHFDNEMARQGREAAVERASEPAAQQAAQQQRQTRQQA